MTSTPKTKVLLVDDDETLLAMYEQILTARNYQVVTATNGQTAIALAKREQPDIILLDILLPGQSGLDVLKKIRAHPETQATPVIMLTVLTDDAIQLEAKEAGADRFFVKSDTIPGKIVEAIEEELSKSQVKHESRR